jgi:hypothetical protein
MGKHYGMQCSSHLLDHGQNQPVANTSQMLCHHLFFQALQHRRIKNGASNQLPLGHSGNETFCEDCDNEHHPQHLVLLVLTGIHQVLAHNHEVRLAGSC